MSHYDVLTICCVHCIVETLLWSDEQYGSISYVYHDSQYEITHDIKRQLVMTYRALFADPPEHNVEGKL